MLFGKYLNGYYKKHAPILIVGLLSLILVDSLQLVVPELYRTVVNGLNTGFA